MLLLGLLSAAALASCSIKEELQPESAVLRFRGTMEQIVPDTSTKAYATHDAEAKKYHIYWNADDRVSIFEEKTYNREYRFTGKDGAPSGSFVRVGTDPSHISEDDIETGYQYAIFPYDDFFNYCEDDGTLSVLIPAEQEYYDDKRGIGARLLMVARDKTGDFSFKHVGSYIGVTLKGEGVLVKSISFRGNNDETLAGDPFVTFNDNGEPVVTFDPNSPYNGKVITMEFKDDDSPFKLSSTEKEFWLVVPPITLSKGYTLTVTDVDGGVFQKITSDPVTLNRKGFRHCRATVVTTIPVASISLNKEELSLFVGANETLVAKVEPNNASNKAVTWTSGNKSVATVDETGKVTAVAAGTATITAPAGGKSASCTVTVSDDISYSLALSPATATIDALKTQEYTATLTTVKNGNTTSSPVAATLTSSKPGVATVNGLVATGVAEGETTITASFTPEGATNAVTATATLTVKDVISHSLTLSPATATIDALKTQEYTATLTTVKNGNTTSSPVAATLTSSKPGVATVNGLVATGVAEGETTITASFTPEGATNAVTATATLTVKDVYEYSLALTPAGETINVGATQTYTATLTTIKNGGTPSTSTVTATLSSSTGAATVDGMVVTGASAGTATITAKYTPAGSTELTATASLNVKDVVSYRLAIDPESAEIIVNSTKKFVAKLFTTTNGTEDQGSEVTATWSITSGGEYATIATDGTATGVKEGTATITAKYKPAGSTEQTATASLKVNKDPNHAGDPIVIGPGGSF